MAARPPDRPDHADPLPPLKLTSALVVGAVLFIAALAVSANYEVDSSRMEAEQRAAREIDALARVFAEQARRSLQTVDVLLRAASLAYHDGILPPLDSRQMHEQLAAQRDQVPDVTALFITDAQGMRLNSSTSYPSARASVAGSTLIQGLQTRPPGEAYVGESVRGVSSGSWLVPLARRLEGRDGRMDGVIGALLDANYFDKFYAAVHLERGTSVALLGERDALVAQFPPDDEAVGVPVTAYQGFPRDDAASNPSTVVRGVESVIARIRVAGKERE
jgi:hypothetical protein